MGDLSFSKPENFVACSVLQHISVLSVYPCVNVCVGLGVCCVSVYVCHEIPFINAGCWKAEREKAKCQTMEKIRMQKA